MKKENPDQELEEIIQSIFEEHKGNYGYRRVHLELRNRGIKANHKKVQRIMNKRGLKGDKFRLKSRKYSSYKGTTGTVAENRNQSLLSHNCVSSKINNRYYGIQVFRRFKVVFKSNYGYVQRRNSIIWDKYAPNLRISNQTSRESSRN
ncbi:transposase InsO family protein [Bacillus niacini]|uniref:Transposase InsO family protein n=1 Tax=Neobacillus niacini TaxID=86668 RepID=A0A852T7F1_9BACI|nr:transposase InsO family protein [Neobacillus niacini]